jgi:uncharacterized protein YndB with AHSA1/START domain
LVAEECEPVKVSKKIGAEPAVIFALLADPARHQDFDGTGMLRTAASGSMIARVGDEFTMNMFFEPRGGDYQVVNRVVEFVPDRRIGWEPLRQDAGTGDVPAGEKVGHRWSYELVADGPGSTLVTEIYNCSGVTADLKKMLRDGRVWEDAMTKSLDRLDALVNNSDQ